MKLPDGLGKWLAENWFKVACLICLLVIALSYVSYLSRKESNRVYAEQQAATLKSESEKKEYVADRKSDCLAVYKTEDDKWNNVEGWRYDEDADVCYITYRESNPKSDAQCDKDWPTGGDYKYIFLAKNLMCKEGIFEKSF